VVVFSTQSLRRSPPVAFKAPNHVAARHRPPSRTTSPSRNDQTGQGLLPAREDRVCTPNHR
jgi:hypothetical protein